MSEGRPVVLLVEDEAATARALAAVLGEFYAVRTARDGLEALVAARASPPDIVVTDLHMPHLDGVQLLRELAQDARDGAKPIPAIMLTADGPPGSCVQGHRAGAAYYMPKGCDVVNELVPAIEGVLMAHAVQRTAT